MALSRINSSMIGAGDVSNTEHAYLNSVTSNVQTQIDAAGKVLQVKADYEASGFSTSSNTFQDTGLSIAITPSSTSNKIIVFASLECSKNGNFGMSAGIRLLRDSTQVYNADYDIYDQDVANVFLAMNKSIFIEDSPASTSSLTYKIQMNSSGNTNTMSLGATSSMIVMEVAG